MTQDFWPSPEPAEPRSPLPRVEDLPLAPEGYDRERVREAFDAFYRHLARLDTTLKAIEAVDVFRDQAAELRKEIRALRTAGWTQQQPWTRTYAGREPLRPGIPPALTRLVLELALIVAVAVVVAVADFSALVIGASIGGAFLIVALVEIVAGRERPLPTAPVRPVVPAPAEAPPPPAPAPAVDEAAWAALPAETEEEAEEELTVVAAAAEAVDEGAEEPEPPAEEPEPVAGEPVAEEPLLPPEPEEEPEAPRRGWFRRRRPDEEEEEQPLEPVAAEPEPAEPEPEEAEEPEEQVAAAVAEPEEEELESTAEEPPRRRRWFRRRREEQAEDEEPEYLGVQPRHVRVLPHEQDARAGAPLDPWEADDELPPAAGDGEPEPAERRPPA